MNDKTVKAFLASASSHKAAVIRPAELLPSRKGRSGDVDGMKLRQTSC